MMKKMISHEELSSFCMELSLLFHAGVGAGSHGNVSGKLGNCH